MAAAVAQRTATGRRQTNRPRSSGETEKSIWSSLLESVATGKRLSEKTLLILGGTIETQKNYLDALSHDPSQRRRPAERGATKKPPVANKFALGYTYQDVLDADQDDILARLSEYLLTSPHPSFTTLLPPLFTSKSVPDLAVSILLDWGEPWLWLRQIRAWIRAIRVSLEKVDDDVKEALEENMKDWKQRRKGPKAESSAAYDYSAEIQVTLGPGEWDEPLGVPICIVCQNAEKIEILEREHGWKEHDFDTVLIFLRTVLLKHGGSLIYTASAAPGALQPLTRSMLDIHSILQKNALKHNVNDRDKVLVPPNWDSWGKIRPLREGFDFEAVSAGWSMDIESPLEQDTGSEQPSLGEGSAIALYESQIRDPASSSSPITTKRDMLSPTTPISPSPSTPTPSSAISKTDDIPTPCPSNQEFFARQLTILERLKAEDEASTRRLREGRKGGQTGGTLGANSGTSTPLPGDQASRVSEHIGPVQFNMGGIQVDAEEMLARLRERGEAAGRGVTGTGGGASTPGGNANGASAAAPVERAASPFGLGPSGDGGKAENESLRSFFASLASKGGASGTNSPRGDGK